MIRLKKLIKEAFGDIDSEVTPEQIRDVQTVWKLSHQLKHYLSIIPDNIINNETGEKKYTYKITYSKEFDQSKNIDDITETSDNDLTALIETFIEELEYVIDHDIPDVPFDSNISIPKSNATSWLGLCIICKQIINKIQGKIRKPHFQEDSKGFKFVDLAYRDIDELESDIEFIINIMKN